MMDTNNSSSITSLKISFLEPEQTQVTGFSVGVGVGVGEDDDFLSSYKYKWRERGAVSLSVQKFLITLYTSTAVLAFIGNLIVILVMKISRRCAKNLRKFLINLAISDLLVGVICVPFSYTYFMLRRWVFAPLLCPVSQFVLLTSGFVTAFTLTSIGIERYIATMHPVSSTNSWLKNHTTTILLYSWLIAAALALIPVWHTEATQFSEYSDSTRSNETFYQCYENWDGIYEKIYTAATFFITFLIPMIVMAVCYGAIGNKMLKYKSPSNRFNSTRTRAQLVSKFKAVEMMTAVVILFIFCWLPIRLLWLIYSFWPESLKIESKFHYYTFVITYFVSHWLAMANSFVNPLIYCFMSQGFRADLIDLLTKIIGQLARNHVANRIST